jgi:hypothetical protein
MYETLNNVPFPEIYQKRRHFRWHRSSRSLCSQTFAKPLLLNFNLILFTNNLLDLAATNLYNLTVPTRDPSSPSALAILSSGGKTPIKLLQASYTTQDGLREALKGQDAVFFNMNSFTLSEPLELYWTIRAYEISIQSGVQHFIYSGAGNRLAQHGYKEEFRNAHNAIAGHLTSWLEGQDSEIMAWTVITGGVYAEMLSSLLRPVEKGEMFVFAAPIGRGSMPLMPLDDYGALVKWVLENPGKSVGKRVNGAPFVTIWTDLAKAFSKATGKKAVSRDLSQDEWFEGIKEYVDPEARMPMGALVGDETSTTFRKSFGAWWNLWKFNERDEQLEREQRVFMEEVNPGRPASLVEWMKRTGYNGVFEEALKIRKDGDSHQ